MHTKPHNEWVVVFYPTTGTVRLHASLELAESSLSKSGTYESIYESSDDLKMKFDHKALEKAWEEIHKTTSWDFPRTATGSIKDYDKTPPDTDTDNLVNLLWQFMQDVGDRIDAPVVHEVKIKDRYELKLEDMKNLMSDTEVFKKKYNNQARILFTALYDNDKQFVVQSDIDMIVLDLVSTRKLKTRQDPRTVFQYYRPQFIKDGYMIRG